jgi:uncharacterized protein (TIGR03435 family)
VYVLEIAKDKPKLPSHKDGTCASPGSNAPLHGPGALTPCGIAAISMSKEGTRLVEGNIPIDEFARIVSTVLGRTVIDQTGLADGFDLDLVFVPRIVILSRGKACSPMSDIGCYAVEPPSGPASRNLNRFWMVLQGCC